MQIIKFDQSSEDPRLTAVGVGALVLKRGGVVMHPTETCYGLAADVFNKSALEKLYKLKKMDAAKPVSMMVSGLEEAQKYAEFNELAVRLAAKFWPGPVALVLPRKNTLPDFFNPGSLTVGIRCPDSLVSLDLIKKFGGPLTTTSANISGQPEVYKVEDFLAQLVAREPGDMQEGDLQPDEILNAGEIPKNLPSTIVGFDERGPFLIREGVLAAEVKQFFTLE